jgi:hypothetical protein
MLSKPFAGWTNLKIGELEFIPSYLTDVPQQFIDAFEQVLKNNLNDQVIVLDGEDKGELLFVIGRTHFYAIECEQNKLYDLNDINIYKLVKEFIKDIENNYILWQDWDLSEPKKYNLENLKKLLKE